MTSVEEVSRVSYTELKKKMGTEGPKTAIRRMVLKLAGMRASGMSSQDPTMRLRIKALASQVAALVEREGPASVQGLNLPLGLIESVKPVISTKGTTGLQPPAEPSPAPPRRTGVVPPEAVTELIHRLEAAQQRVDALAAQLDAPRLVVPDRAIGDALESAVGQVEHLTQQLAEYGIEA
jgi:hypothetical protein